MGAQENIRENKRLTIVGELSHERFLCNILLAPSFEVEATSTAPHTLAKYYTTCSSRPCARRVLSVSTTLAGMAHMRCSTAGGVAFSPSVRVLTAMRSERRGACGSSTLQSACSLTQSGASGGTRLRGARQSAPASRGTYSTPYNVKERLQTQCAAQLRWTGKALWSRVPARMQECGVIPSTSRHPTRCSVRLENVTPRSTHVTLAAPIHRREV